MGLLEGKVCLVTGASRGIGLATVRRFVEEGAMVYANIRQPKNLDSLCKEWSGELPGKVRAIYFDVRDEIASRQAFMEIKHEAKRLDVLVNNAGIMKDAFLGMITHAMLQEIYETNVFGTLSMTQLSIKLMESHGNGSIINLSSIVGLEGNPGQMVYAATKGAVAAMTKTAAKELANKGIRVNAVAPGMIDTDMFRSVGEKKMAEHLRNIRMGRLGMATEVADTILFLASDLSRYVTGEIIGVNGSAMI